VSGVGGVCSDFSCPFPDSGGVQVLDGGDDQLCNPVSQRNWLNSTWVVMNTNAHSISTPVKVRYYFEASWPCWWTNCNPPSWLIQCFLKCVKDKVLCRHPSVLETNESVFFLRLRPRWDDPSSRARNRLIVSLCDREIKLRGEKVSATSITCTVLPAIIRSLKAILKWFRKGNISLPRWTKVFIDMIGKRYFPLLWFTAKDFPHILLLLFPPLF